MSRSIDAFSYSYRPLTARRRILAAVVFVGLLGPLTCSGIHDDELSCEEAVAHLRDCCSNFDPASIHCSNTVACGNSPNPQLNLDQSSCLLGRSCEDLNSNTTGTGSACERAVTSAANMMPLPPLCP